MSEYLAFDKTYAERLKIRQSLMDEFGRETYDCDPKAEAAVMEMYEWMFGVYLPKRLPALFSLVEKRSDEKLGDGHFLHNRVTGGHIPLKASSARQALYTLGKNVDGDILFLLPSSTAADGSPIYHLEAYVVCFPSGFSLPKKFRLPLASIHKPVPNYKEKLEKSMDRFFAKLETGRAVRRSNWTVTTHPKLYTQTENHLYANGHTKEGEESGSDTLQDTIEEQQKSFKLEDCRLRTERQTLHRLPKTQALVFAFKTYQYLLEDVKAEGSGPALAEAIDGLTLGNSPEMEYYKRGVVWGGAVKEYLLS